MRRLAVLFVLLALVATACTDPAPPEEQRVGVVAEVEVAGQPNPITHGSDVLPPRPASMTAQAAPEVSWPCEGTGADGRRVQMVYAHGGSSSLSVLRSTFETWTRQIEGMFLLSAQETGGERLVRFVTNNGAANCSLSIEELAVSASALSSFDQMITELVAAGLNRNDRIYHVWSEGSSYCGIGTVYTDDRPTDNYNEQFSQYSRTDRSCWNVRVAAHEIVHNLGGVQNTAPNSTGGLHSRDEHDVMSYPDGAPQGQMIQRCPPIGEDRLDCEKNDYFSTSPLGGSYLATHWNVANASALTREAAPTTTLPPTPTTTSTTLPPTTTTTVGDGGTETDLVLPRTIRQGVPFDARATVTGDCGPTGTVAFYVSGKLMSRQVLVGGSASVTLTILTSVERPTIRADYGGSDTCDKSRDSVRKRLAS